MEEADSKLLAAAKRLPLAERIEHSNWKVRSAAHEDVKAACESAFSSEDPILNESGPLFAKSVGDTNANAMDKALDSLCAWLSKADESQASRISSSVCSTIASKCLKARPTTVARATEACLLFVELEQGDQMIESISAAFQDKIPKAVLAALDVVYRTIAEFGIDNAVNAKSIIKSLPSLFSHSNAGVRDKVKELTVELAAFAGPTLVRSTLVDKMNDAMKKDVDANIAALPSKRKQPQRFTRKETKNRAAAVPRGENDVFPYDNNHRNREDGDGDTDTVAAMDLDGGDMDPFDFSDPVDMMPQLRKAIITIEDDSVPFWDCFESKKWNVRKGALDAAKGAIASTARLAGNAQEQSDLCRELKKILAKDANIPCATAAAEVVGLLANRLRKDFASHARQLCGALLERFKEKNSSMSKAAEDSLKAMATHCYSLADVAEDVASALGHKNPKVRLDTLRLLCYTVVHADASDVGRSKDGLLPAVVKLAPDADPNIREAAQSVVVAFSLKLGSFSAVKSYLSKLDESRSKMIEDAAVNAAKNGGIAAMMAVHDGGASVKSSMAASSRPTSASTPSRSVKSSLGGGGGGGGGDSSKPSVSAATAPRPAKSTPPVAQRPTSSARPTASAASASDRINSTAGQQQLENEISAATSGRPSAEEAEQRLVDKFGSATVEELRSPQWQARLEAMTAVADELSKQKEDPDTASFLLCLAHLPGWSEKNFQVLNKTFEAATVLAQDCPGFTIREAAAAVEGAGDKIHELKHRSQASEVLSAASEAVGPRFVVAYLHSRAASNKNPKVLSEALSWLASTVDDFGVAALDIPAIIRWMIEDLGSPNAPVRNQAMAVLGRCHAQIGSGLVSQVSSSVKPAQLTALEEVFKKNPSDPEYVPIRKIKKRKNTAGGGSHGRGPECGRSLGKALGSNPSTVVEDHMEDNYDDDGGGGGGAAGLDSLLPRADIGSQLTPSLVGQIGSPNWKERNAALEAVEGILQSAGNRISANVPAELFSELRGRISDTNRNLAARALLLIGKLADAMGPPFDKLARPILSSTLLALSDNKKQVRDAVMAMLDAWVKTCQPERLFLATVDGISNPKCSNEGKVAVLTWMGNCILDISKKKDGKKAALQCIEAALKAAAVAATDKSGTVREAGLRLLVDTVQSTSGEDVMNAVTGSVDAKTRKVVEASVQRAVSTACGGVSSPGGGRAAAPVIATRTSSSASAASPVGGPKTLQRTKSTAAATPSRAASATVPPPALISARDPEQQEPILAMNTGKSQRAKQFRPRVGKFEPPSPSEVELLEQYLSPVASEEFRSQLFSQDFRDHVKAADALGAAASFLLAEITAALDLLLRWCVLRICDGNPQALLRVLEALLSVFTSLAEQGYQCNDIEAGIILPAIVEKCGHSQERVRSLYRDVLHSMCRVHPTQKVLDCVVAQGLSGSKNSRTRVECCEFLAGVVEEQGTHVVISCKCKPVMALAGILKERDGSLRSAALSVIEAVFTEQGPETTWKLLGRLDAREKDMIDDRLKRSLKQNPSTIGATARMPTSRSTSRSTFAAGGGDDDDDDNTDLYQSNLEPRSLAFDHDSRLDNNNNSAAATVYDDDDEDGDDDDIDYSGFDQHNRARLSSYMAGLTTKDFNKEHPAASLLEYSRPKYTPPNTLDMTPPDALDGKRAAIEVDGPRGDGGSNEAAIFSAIPTPVPKPRAPSPSRMAYAETAAALAAAPTATTAVTATAVPAILPEMTGNANYTTTSSSSSTNIPAINPHDAEFEQRWSRDLQAISDPSLPEAIEATKQLCADLQAITQQTDPPMSRRIRAILVESSQRLFATITAQLEAIISVAEREAAATGPGTASSRGCKYALTALLNSIGVQEVATTLPQGTLRDTIAVLLRQLSSGMEAFEERGALVKPINVIVGKMLDAADRNLAFAALLQLLREPPKVLKPEEVPKFNDFVVKCLIKSTKGLHSNPDSFDFSILLFNLHDFFMFLGVEEIRRRSYADDKPLKMVKTIIHEICKIKGYAIYEHATRIHPGRHSQHPPAIFAYIRSALTSYEKSGVIQPASEEDEAREAAAMASSAAASNPAVAASGGPTSDAASPGGSAVGLDAKAQVTKAEVKQRLKEIMTGLVSRDRNQQDAAMVELYRLKKEQPQYVERYIAGTSTMFRQFIDDGLAKLEAQGTVLVRQQQQQQQQPGDGDPGEMNAPKDSPTPVHVQSSYVYSTRGQSPHSQSQMSSIKERMSQLRADALHRGTNGAVGLSVEELSRRREQLKRGGGD